MALSLSLVRGFAASAGRVFRASASTVAPVRFLSRSPALFQSSGASTVDTGALAAPSYTIEEAPVTQKAKVLKRAQGVIRNVRGHTKKLNPIARQIVGLSVNEAMAQMAFSPSQRREPATKALSRALQQAEIFHRLPQDNMMVEAAWTGLHQSSMRVRHHSKGRAGRAHKRTSMLSIRLREMTKEEEAKKNKFHGKPTPDTIAALNPRAY